MSSNPDQFFEEEEELARKDARPAGASKACPAQQPAKGAAPRSAAPANAPKPPSFAQVVAIAAVALLLGIGIGYFAAMAVVDRTATDAAPQAQQAVVAADDSVGGTISEAEMPAGHPDIASLMNPDGTVNQEAVDAYKAQLAADKADAGEDGDASTTGADK